VTITVVFGTRPEAIKLGPVVAELDALGADVRVLCTGQHTHLLAGTPAESDLKHAESLGLASDGKVLRWLDRAERAIRAKLVDASGVVVVQGDTMSALAATRAAWRPTGSLVAHVEAGVRSHNIREPWPEEAFRCEIDSLADWYYAPTTSAYANLVAEGHPANRILVTGNTVVSALERYTRATPVPPSDHCLVTLHRREFLQSGHFVEVLDALAAAAADHAAARFFWPMHPVVEPMAARWLLRLPSNLIVSKPMPYREAAGVLAHAFGVLTDSGGLIEEAATLGVPSVQLRNVSDRPEAIEAGVSRLEPPTAEGVYRALQALSTGALPRRPSAVFGDTGSAAAVARHLSSLNALAEVN
jgi:UDP-N-acetylglucosamine 2-epimerase (non-hydrolysing)